MSGTIWKKVGLLGGLLIGAGCPADSGSDATATEGGATSSETSGEEPTSATTGGESESAEGGGSTSGGQETSADASSGGETGDPSGGEICGDIPTRMMFFGDSLFACYGQDGGKDAPSCGARLAHEYLAENYAPEVTYENLAVSGAVTRDVVMDQMPGAPVGMPGHTLVVIWIGGNDISGLLLSSDADADSTYHDQLAPELEMLWDEMLAFVDDPANFPDGATLIINTQFNPFDDCSADPYAFMSPLKTELLAEYNEVLRDRVSGRPNTYLADQFPVFLGHGHHFATESCPYYTPDSAYWMLGGTDLVHPNGLGHVSIAGTLDGTIDAVFQCD